MISTTSLTDSVSIVVTRPNTVPVIFSTHSSIGWYTKYRDLQLLFDPTIIGLIEEHNDYPEHQADIFRRFAEYTHHHYPHHDIKPNVLAFLMVEKVEKGCKFTINWWGGGETLVKHDEIEWITASAP